MWTSKKFLNENKNFRFIESSEIHAKEIKSNFEYFVQNRIPKIGLRKIWIQKILDIFSEMYVNQIFVPFEAQRVLHLTTLADARCYIVFMLL